MLVHLSQSPARPAGEPGRAGGAGGALSGRSKKGDPAAGGEANAEQMLGY